MTDLNERARAMAALRQDALQLGAQVLGEGNLEASLMLVGEAPGEAEVAAQRPFVGPAGKVLDRLLARLSIPRDALWITNVVKLRPVLESGENRINRPPRVGEVQAFRGILDREIAIIRPAVILGLGATAAAALAEPNLRIRDVRGHWFPGPGGARVLVTYHPSYLLRLRGPDYEAARDAMLADLALAWGEAQQLTAA
jgi:uracil-DNA glycosylase family 4